MCYSSTKKIVYRIFSVIIHIYIFIQVASSLSLIGVLYTSIIFIK